MRKSFIALGVAVSLGLIGLVGCGSGPKVLGTWKFGQQMGGQSVDITLDIMKDGKMTQKSKVQGVDFTAEGTWKFEGDQLTMTPNKVTIGEMSKEMESFRPMFEKSISETVNKPVVGTVKFVGDDAMEVTMNGNTVTMTKVK